MFADMIIESVMQFKMGSPRSEFIVMKCLEWVMYYYDCYDIDIFLSWSSQTLNLICGSTTQEYAVRFIFFHVFSCIHSN